MLNVEMVIMASIFLLQKCDEIAYFDDSLLLKEVSYYLRSSSAKMKRISNIYRVGRLLSNQVSLEKIKLLKWVILIEQWPVRMAWLIRFVEDGQKTFNPLETHQLFLHSKLVDFYNDHVKLHVYNISKENCPESLVNEYSKLYLLDLDPHEFEILLHNSGILVDDLGTYSTRSASKLLTYTFGLNPTIRNVIRKIAAYRSGNEKSRVSRSQETAGLVEKPHLPTSSSSYEKLHPIGGDLGSEIESRTQVLNNALVVDLLPSRLEDLVPSSDASAEESTENISFLRCALAFSSLIRYGLKAPVIIGLYSAVGNDYFAESIFSSLKTLWLHEKLQLLLSTQDQKNYAKSSSVVDKKPISSAEKKLFSEGFQLGSQLSDIESSAHFASLESPRATKSDSKPCESPSYPPIFSSQQTAKLRNESKDMQEKLMMFLESNSEGELDDLYQWYLLDCPASALKMTDKNKIDKQKLSNLVDNRNKEFSSFECVRELISGFFTGFTQALRDRYDFHSHKVRPASDIYQYLRDARVSIASMTEKTSIGDYEFVKWDALLFSGTDNLWAGIIKALNDSVELHYGPNYKYAHAKATAYWILFLCTICIALAALSAYLLSSSQLNQIQDNWPTLLSIVGSGVTGITAFVQSHMPANIFESKDFQNKLGFMSAIREEICKIGDLLRDPNSVPTVWDYLLWWLGPLRPSAKVFCGRAFGGGLPLEHLNPCLLIILITGLDNCSPELTVEVLRSLQLLTENSPIVVLLASDPDLLLSAIEAHWGSSSHSNRSSFEILDKIVAIPIAVPEMVEAEKQAFCASQLEAHEEEVLCIIRKKVLSSVSETTAVITLALPMKPARNLIIQFDCHNAASSPVQMFLILRMRDETTRRFMIDSEFIGSKKGAIQLQPFDHFVYDICSATAISFVVESSTEAKVQLEINYLALKCIVAQKN